MRQLLELDESECKRLLVGGGIGRVAVNTPDGPYIVPQNYSIVDDVIVFATSADSMLAKFAAGTDVAFEVDSVDFRQQEGWSVVVRGRGEIVTDAEDLQWITMWPPRPGAPGARDTYIRVRLAEVSGRQLLARPHSDGRE